MQPLEPIEVINQRLVDYFGRFPNSWPNWKLVWSEDFTERRLVYSTPEGFDLIEPIVETRKKCEYLTNRYMLVKLIEVPEINQDDLCGAKVTYEPVWTFEDDKGNPLPPKWEAIQAIITTIIQAVEMAGHKGPYKQDEKDGNSVEAIIHRRKLIEEQLFGNETSITDSLGMDSAVGYGTRNRKDWVN